MVINPTENGRRIALGPRIILRSLGSIRDIYHTLQKSALGFLLNWSA